MITKKPRGSISAVQPSGSAQPIFASDFPDTCQLSKFVLLSIWVLCFQQKYFCRETNFNPLMPTVATRLLL